MGHGEDWIVAKRPLTHYVPIEFFDRRVAQARCGTFVRPLIDHSIEPTCPRCAAALDLELRSDR